MDEIAKAFGEYVSLLAHLKWLKENGQLAPDADVGSLAFQGSIVYTSPVVIEAFAASIEIIKVHQEYLATLPKRPRGTTGEKEMAAHEARLNREREIYEKARALATLPVAE